MCYTELIKFRCFNFFYLFCLRIICSRFSFGANFYYENCGKDPRAEIARRRVYLFRGVGGGLCKHVRVKFGFASSYGELCQIDF